MTLIHILGIAAVDGPSIASIIGVLGVIGMFGATAEYAPGVVQGFLLPVIVILNRLCLSTAAPRTPCSSPATTHAPRLPLGRLPLSLGQSKLEQIKLAIGNLSDALSPRSDVWDASR